jgi:hypothetical protein
MKYMAMPIGAMCRRPLTPPNLSGYQGHHDSTSQPVFLHSPTALERNALDDKRVVNDDGPLSRRAPRQRHRPV